jgi:putative ABC transport system permease protein
MHNFISDLKYGFRMLARKPGFTALAILTLALGIGANTAIFSVVDAVLIRPLPFRTPDQLVQLFETESAPGNFPLTGQDYLDWRAQNRTFEDMAVYSYQTSYNVSAAGEPQRAQGVQVQANFFDMLGVQPFRGRAFLNGEDQSGRNHVAILSYAFWRQNFGGQLSAIGGTVKLNGEAYTVVGVMPAWYRTPGGADLWVPIDATAKGLGSRGTHHLRAIGRIKAGVSLEQARADLRAVAAGLAKQFPDSNGDETAVLVPLREQIIGNTGGQLWTMFGAVGLVLLIACVNVANLLLARATDRRREVAVRVALGAERQRLVRQLLTESVLLSILGAIPGIALAYVCVSLLGNSQHNPFPQPNPLGVNPAVLGFTLAVSVLIGVLFGLVPAIQSAQVNLVDDLKSSGRMASTVSRSTRAFRNALVITEIALSLALLAGAALLLRTFANLRAVDLGVNADKVLTASVLLPQAAYGGYDRQVAFYDKLARALETAPGIRAAALTTEIPLQGGNNGYVKIDGQDTKVSAGELVEWTSTTPGYLRAMGIPLLSGRALADADMAHTAEVSRKLQALPDNATPPPNLEISVVINQTMARKFWANQDPLGRTFHANGAAMRIVGVVSDVKIFGLRQPPIAQAYMALTWDIGPRTFPMTLAVRGTGRPEDLAGTVRAVVRSLDPALAVFAVASMKQIVSDTMGAETDQTVLLGTFAALALLLAGVGTYGVMSYLVTQRTGEIGIRMALGAARANVLWMVIRKGMILATVGIGIGLLGAYFATSLMKSMLFGVQPNDPATLALASAVMAAVALAACLVPALRAMRVEPVIALRYE